MKILEHVRTLAGVNFTRREVGGGVILSGDGHTHNNLPLLQNITDSTNHKYLKINNVPVQTHLLEEQW